MTIAIVHNNHMQSESTVLVDASELVVIDVNFSTSEAKGGSVEAALGDLQETMAQFYIIIALCDQSGLQGIWTTY